VISSHVFSVPLEGGREGRSFDKGLREPKEANKIQQRRRKNK